MRRRIVAIYLLLAIMASSFVALVSYRYSSDLYVDEVEFALQNEAVLIGQIIKTKGLDSINDEFLNNLSNSLMSMNQNKKVNNIIRRITIIDTDGSIIADSGSDSELMDNHSDRVEFINAISNRTGTDIRKSETTGISLIYHAYYSQDLDCVIRVSGPLQHIIDIRNTILFYSVIAVLASMIISAVMALIFSSYIVRPVARLVKKYGGAVTSKNNNWGNKDEINQLSQTLSSMTQSIEDTIKELKERNIRVNTIINSMDSGLIAVDSSMNIIMINPNAKKLLDLKDNLDYIGTPLVQAIRNNHINDILLKGISENVVLNDEMYLYQGGRRTLSIHVSPIYKSENNETISGALAYINDITQIRKLEEIRSEFVSNVTHELKTPLTSIQGFVETLKNGAILDPVVSEKFLDIIEIETERLRMLINDILELSEIESTKTDNDKNTFVLLELVQEVESMLNNSASEKEINFDIQIDSGLKVMASRNRIKQLLINLMDNAIKYNKLGGSVTVRAQHFGGQVEIHVKDTGIGVPKEHTKRIFERFYRVDKGRSREIGGTGLGLSIVKHIAQLYGGYINIESEEGKGSDFIVTLPIHFKA